MFDPVKKAFGSFLASYYAGIVPTTLPLQEYVARGLALSVVRAPERMVDAAEDMLEKWQRHDAGTETRPVQLPVIIFALSKDHTPTGRDYGRQVADQVIVTIPDDPKERAFGLRALAADIRAQVVFFSHDEPSARSLAAQFLLFLDATANRRFTARYTFAGFPLDWPVQVESPELPAVAVQTEAKNLTILAVDVTLKAEVPLFDAPTEDEPNDGQGVPGTDDPSGYPLVTRVLADSREDNDQGGSDQIRDYVIEAPVEDAP